MMGFKYLGANMKGRALNWAVTGLWFSQHQAVILLLMETSRLLSGLSPAGL